ncbi:MAG: hypothetical protein AB7D36_09440 [Oscillospiraceae bacterium]
MVYGGRRRSPAASFAQKAAYPGARRTFGKTITLSLGALSLISQYHGEGNVRHLRNLCERLTVVSGGETISEQQVLMELSTNTFLERPFKA